MKRLVREFDFSPEQLQTVKEIATSLDLTETTAAILYARGMDTVEKVRRFLHPSADNFLSPFLMRGMKEACELIETARREDWRVALFGDYDADGIGACAVLSRALKQLGIEPYLYVPERTEGYGMSMEAVDKIFDEFLPDLVITLDCGISNAAEVRYIQELGASVIVTDHHELPDVLPDCICINPKFQDDYPYDNLCGAGVAWKLSQALIGEKANSLLDFAALSTVADSVPLLGENRDIVAEGLRLFQNHLRPCFAALLEKPCEVTAQTLSFHIAPRVNAAGRMGDARSALELFTTEDGEEIAKLAEKLIAYNAERQKYCDDLYAQARAQIARKGAYGNVIFLAGEDWNAGFVGIVAARLAEEFSRPALLFVRRGEMLRGSARSIDEVNIFEALRACSQYIEEFGGHAQAAGINVKAEHFEALEEALDRYIGEHYSREQFAAKYAVSGEIADAFDQKLARELNALEPYGVGNRRPLFTLTAASMGAVPLKPQSPHLSVNHRGMEFLYFGGAQEMRLLRSGMQKQLVFEFNVSTFRGREYIKGFIRGVFYDGASDLPEGEAFENAVLALKESRRAQGEYLSQQKMNTLIEERMQKCAYGLCVVAARRETLSLYPALRGVAACAFDPPSDVGNTVLLAPRSDCDLSAYREVLFLDDASTYGVVTGQAKVYLTENAESLPLQGVSAEREELLRVFSALKRTHLTGETLSEIAQNGEGLGFLQEELIFALAVFEELGLVRREGGELRVFRGLKTKLEDSAIYRAVAARSVGE